MTYVRSGPVSLYVETTGEGYPIVFVHEFASDHREWEPQVRWFSRSYRCVTYNARGYPPSDVPEDPEQYGWEFAVADLLAVLDGLDIPVAHLVGLSMGGYAVLQFALRHPERVSAVVASATGSGSAPGDRDQWPTRRRRRRRRVPSRAAWRRWPTRSGRARRASSCSGRARARGRSSWTTCTSTRRWAWPTR